MAGSFKRLGFSLLLIVFAAAILLWSDRHNRRDYAEVREEHDISIKLAILQHSSNPIMDDIRDGLLQGLKNKGFSDGHNIAVTIYNAEGDLPTGNLMAQKIAGGGYRLAASISTVMLQALANANRAGKVVQVFGGVTSPVAAGVGIKAIGTLDKPPYLSGIGTPQPVEEIFRLAKQINPSLKTVGVVWNPAEVNSEVCTKQARKVAAELGLKLLEAPVEHGKDVREAAASLAARGVDAFWTGGDATVIAVVDSLIEAARAAHIPVFSNVAGHARRGTLFDYGANYYEVGVREGEIAGDILAGADPSTIAVEDFVPQRIILNEQVGREFGSHWHFDDALKARADVIINAAGKEIAKHPAEASTKPRLIPGKKFKVGVAYFAPEPGIDSVMSGLREGLKTFGLEEGRNLTFRPMHAQSQSAAVVPPAVPLDHKWKIKRLLYVESLPAEEAVHGIDDGLQAAGLVGGRDYTIGDASAQGDMITLSTLADSVNSDGTELLMTLSTPTLQTALHKVTKIPIVFTFVADPEVAGAGSSEHRYSPRITGEYTMAPYAEMVEMLVRYFPQIRKVGTLYTPVEDNSVHNKDVFVEEAGRHGISVETLPVNSPGELPDAALAMGSRPIDAWVQTLDNQVIAGFTVIGQAAARSKKPLFSFTESAVEQGAVAAYTMDYYRAGFDAALKAAQIMRGSSPKDIPYSKPSQVRLIISAKNAKAVGLTLPAELLNKADKRLDE